MPTTFHFRVNDGEEQTIHAKTGVYLSVVAAIPAMFGIDQYPVKITIWAPSLLPDYGPYHYGIEQPGGAVAIWAEREGQVTLIYS
jgi:hypothetical protein